MTHKLSPLAPAAAAIAAVLAFPATATTAPAPVIDIAPVAQPAPAPVPAPAPSIVIAPAPPPAPPAETAQQTAAPAVPREAARAVTRERTAAAPVARARAASAPAAAASSDAAVAEAPVSVPVETDASTVAVLPEPVVEEVAPVVASDSAADDMIAYALVGAGAAALGIGGLAFAARRRRRIADRDVDTVPMADRREAPVREPVMARPIPSGAPAPFAYVTPRQPERTVSAPRTGMGRHEAMVDVGPTEDNPFLTRKNRLRRARFLDRMEANGWLPREQRRMAGAR